MFVIRVSGEVAGILKSISHWLGQEQAPYLCERFKMERTMSKIEVEEDRKALDERRQGNGLGRSGERH